MTALLYFSLGNVSDRSIPPRDPVSADLVARITSLFHSNRASWALIRGSEAEGACVCTRAVS